MEYQHLIDMVLPRKIDVDPDSARLLKIASQVRLLTYNNGAVTFQNLDDGISYFTSMAYLETYFQIPDGYVIHVDL